MRSVRRDDEQARVAEAQQLVVEPLAVERHVHEQAAVDVARLGVALQRHRVARAGGRACSRSPPARSTAPASSDGAFPGCRRPGGARCRGCRRRTGRRPCRRRSSRRRLPMWWIRPWSGRRRTNPTRRSRAGRPRRPRTRPGSGSWPEARRGSEGSPGPTTRVFGSCACCSGSSSSSSCSSSSRCWPSSSRRGPTSKTRQKQVDTTWTATLAPLDARYTLLSQANAPLLPRPGSGRRAGQGRRRRAADMGEGPRGQGPRPRRSKPPTSSKGSAGESWCWSTHRRRSRPIPR